MTLDSIQLDGSPLPLEAVEAVARSGASVHIAESAIHIIEQARAHIDRLASSDQPYYGLNTGFGSLSQVRIEPDNIREVQRNIARSHAAGVGDPLPDEVVRGMLLILTASLCRGHSGVRSELVQRIVDLLNKGVTPIVPSRGSVGASGDLAPLAHAALVLMGEGEANYQGKTMGGHTALAAAGLEPITLEAKEGLALLNGTHLMTSIGALALCDIARLQEAALTGAAMAVDACRASHGPFDARLHEARNQVGQQEVAMQMRERLTGSQIVHDHKENDPRVQDPYSLRAIPQVLGAVLDTIAHVRNIFELELGAVTDNPLIFGESGDVISGGNFHGMPLAIAFDSLKIALSHLAGISERRMYWLLKATDSENPVNEYLSPKPGLHSGLMIVQYTAAACCNEIQTLANPASVANIPTSAGMEDYNSMGATSAHQTRASLDLATNVIAMELLVMAEALEYQRPLKSGDAIEKAYEAIRVVVPRLTQDRPPAPDIGSIAKLIRNGAFSS